ncbi:YdhK family protein [Heyndrickxia oleronia]|uniref:YdhK family protein n=1 Tax=Heyndrickxia oleronia TaxID=38875 RepID=UPI00375090B4
MMTQKLVIGIVSLTLIFVLTACGKSNDSTDNKKLDMGSKPASSVTKEHMEHSSSGEVPDGLKVAEHPTYKIGDKVILKTDHMNGMKDAEATISRAFYTTAYVVTYTPTTGGPKVENHKWVIQEEIKDAGKKTLKPGTEVTLEADHMKGMKGASAEIVSSEKTTVYMVDYTPTTGGPVVKNHKWVTEDEVTAK